MGYRDPSQLDFLLIKWVGSQNKIWGHHGQCHTFVLPKRGWGTHRCVSSPPVPSPLTQVTFSKHCRSLLCPVCHWAQFSLSISRYCPGHTWLLLARGSDNPKWLEEGLITKVCVLGAGRGKDRCGLTGGGESGRADVCPFRLVTSLDRFWLAVHGYAQPWPPWVVVRSPGGEVWEESWPLEWLTQNPKY
jgi:hypothetical protein